MKVIFTADLHGNEEQYRKLIKFAIENSAAAVIIGGDLAPKDEPTDYIGSQRRFFEKRLPELMRPLKEELPDIKVYMMMGNDDCASNLDVFQKYDGLYRDLHMRRFALNEEFDVVGYANVQITPFGLKDWERYDLSNGKTQPDARLRGVKSTTSGFEDFVFTEKDLRQSIESELKNEIFNKNPEKTVYVIHSPPYGTNLDQVHRGHVGSKAVRSFVEQKQPYLTLYGHIHETVEVSGEFSERMGKTYCFTSGNHNRGPLSVLVFDLYEPENVERLVF
jgi:Icc-related predicted phosphoesterase